MKLFRKKPIPVVLDANAPIHKDGVLTENFGLRTLGGILTPLAPIGEPYPYVGSTTFSTGGDYQDHITLTSYRGKDILADNCIFLGKCILRGFNLAPAREPQIKLHFKLYDNKIELWAEDEKDKNDISVTILRTNFIHLNKAWNAEPNAPCEKIELTSNYVELSFYVNPWVYEGYEEKQRVAVRFFGCSRWRLGSVNDEGWHYGQCRFSKLAPAWGEFYDVEGDLLLDKCPDDWNVVGKGIGKRHYLFYLKDYTFECDADEYQFIDNINT